MARDTDAAFRQFTPIIVKPLAPVRAIRLEQTTAAGTHAARRIHLQPEAEGLVRWSVILRLSSDVPRPCRTPLSQEYLGTKRSVIAEKNYDDFEILGSRLDLAKTLIAKGYRVIANSRNIRSSTLSSAAGVLLVDGDIGNPAVAERIVDAAVRKSPPGRSDAACIALVPFWE